MIGSASSARDRMVFFLGGKSLGNGKKTKLQEFSRAKRLSWTKPGNLADVGFMPMNIERCQFNAIDPVGHRANTAESFDITAIGGECRRMFKKVDAG